MTDKEFLYCCYKCGMIVEFDEPHPIPKGWQRVENGILFYHLCPKCATEKVKNNKLEVL